ncbi:SAM-dependent methyltransferase [Acidianus brierleyi]|uniref:Cobalt-precorrin-2 C(20)-methyltransferase n=1 Tax=Acidianus brierleyi TaxID=41673 RepID=A0A2U9IBW0_9CREN|nr:precorrin-2 C(20)-methyltransferase [Acidianus brierleyi]AWR93505.1 cobalt-precorrin-2 C(20)-methyltransferase [Acidianus brierleyi]
MKLFGIGVGPGDPELLTLKAYRIIKESDVVIVPFSSKKITYNIVKDLIANKDIIKFDLPIRKGEEAYKKLIENIRGYNKVAYLTLGDPAFYSSFYRLAKFLEPYEVIPGITSFSWCSAINKIPIALGKENVLITTQYQENDKIDNIILMKNQDKFGVSCGNGYFTVSLIKKHPYY